MATLGKEAAAAMAAVEGQQQRLTLQRLLAMVMYSTSMLFLLLHILKICILFTKLKLIHAESFHCYFPFKVEAERNYHQRVLQILDQLEGEV